MNFYELQQSAFARTRLFSVLFGLLAIPSVLGFVLMLVLVFGFRSGLYGPSQALNDLLFHPHKLRGMWVPAAAASVVLIGGLLLWKRTRFRDAATLMASELECTRVTTVTDDFNMLRAFNINEEMAVAASISPPTLYIWPTAAVNSFVVGYNSSDAAVFVSQGAIDKLTRDEMQALVAHGIGKILNGDMAMNVRLASYLFLYNAAPRVGVFVLGLPVFLTMRLPKMLGKTLATILMLPWLFTGMIPGVAITLVAAPSAVCAKLLQMLATRQRKLLADTCAVQFTRNPLALRDVLVKASNDSSVRTRLPAALADFSHACFVSPGRGILLSANHSVESRVRALVENFRIVPEVETARDRTRAKPVVDPNLLLKVSTPQTMTPIPASAKQKPKAAPIAQETFIERLATLVTILPSAASSPALPLTRLISPEDARAGLLALLIDRQPAIQQRQLECVRGLFGDESVAALLIALRALSPMQQTERTIALDVHLPALRGLPPAELRRLLAAIIEIQKLDSHTDVFEFVVSRVAVVFIADLLSPRAGHGTFRLADKPQAVHMLFSVVAQQGNRSDAALAYWEGTRGLAHGKWPKYERKEEWARALDEAFDQLDRLQPVDKEMLIEALTKTIRFDGEKSPIERELLRATAACLHCSLPRL